MDDIWIKPLSEDSTETIKILHDMASKMTRKFNEYFESMDDVHQLLVIALILNQ